MIPSTYSCSSFSGLVSSKRRLVLPPNSSANPKSMQIAFACPMCKYPLGSGGKRVWMTASPNFFVLRSSMKISRMKLEARGSPGEFVATSVSVDELVGLITTPFYSHGVNRRDESGARQVLAQTQDLFARNGIVDRGTATGASEPARCVAVLLPCPAPARSQTVAVRFCARKRLRESAGTSAPL